METWRRRPRRENYKNKEGYGGMMPEMQASMVLMCLKIYVDINCFVTFLKINVFDVVGTKESTRGRGRLWKVCLTILRSILSTKDEWREEVDVEEDREENYTEEEVREEVMLDMV